MTKRNPKNDSKAARVSARLGLALVVALIPIRTFAADVVSFWDGTNNNWTSNHWSSTFFPNNGNDGKTYEAVINIGTVTLDQDITVDEFRISSDGTLTGISPFDLTIKDRLTWSSGTLAGPGLVLIEADAEATITNGNPRLFRSLTSDGDVTWTNPGSSLFFINNATFQNNGSFAANANAFTDLRMRGIGGTAVFNNAGTFTKLGLGQTIFDGRINIANTGVEFNNTGTVDVQAGELQLWGGGNHTGDFTGLTGAELEFAGTHDFAPGSAITGGMDVEFRTDWQGVSAITSAGSINTTGELRFIGTTATIEGSVTAGSLYFQAVQPTDVIIRGTVTISDPVTIVSNNSIALGTGGPGGQQGTLAAETTVENGATLSGNGTVNGNLTVGSASGPLDAVVSPGFSVGHLEVQGNYEQTASGRLEIEVDGSGAGQFDTIAIEGQANLGGILVIDASELANPTPGITVTVLTSGGIASGTTFDDVVTVGTDDIFFAPIYSGSGSVELGGFSNGDMNRDGIVDGQDANDFALALVSPTRYKALYGIEGHRACTCNKNGKLDFDDIPSFAELLGGNNVPNGLGALERALANVPEPNAVVLTALAALAGMLRSARRLPILLVHPPLVPSR